MIELEVRDAAVVDRAAHAQKAEIRDVVLAAGVEAAAALDVELVDRGGLLDREALPELTGQAARRRNT